MKYTEGDKFAIMAAYNNCSGKWPRQLDASGTMFYNGTKIVKADFRAIKRDGIHSQRFNL
jgi:hypothetical protein